MKTPKRIRTLTAVPEPFDPKDEEIQRLKNRLADATEGWKHWRDTALELELKSNGGLDG